MEVQRGPLSCLGSWTWQGQDPEWALQLEATPESVPVATSLSKVREN